LLDPGEHERVLDLLLHYYPIVISDTETGLLAPRTTTTLEYADQIVFCVTTDAGAAWQAAATLNWLLHQGGQAADLARRTVVVAHEMRQGTLQDFDVAKEQIASRCRAIMTIPFDAQFAIGGALDLAQLAEGTYDAYLDLAVELAHEFGVITK
jgi:MinD-like ATPase involved in chromosome partitioning or flagellar assembly